MPRALITGGAGFVGQWLTRAMLQRGWEVFVGTVGHVTGEAILTDAERRGVTELELDVTSEAQIVRALDASAPEFVVHLAGIAFPPEANASPARAFEVNAVGALRLLAAIHAAADRARPRVLVVGSSEQYGAHPAAANPLSESAALAPISAYAASKVAQEVVALQAFRSANIPVICTRSFNHSGRGQPGNYFLPAITRRAAALPPTGGALRLGNDTPVRDYLHVEDVVAAYLLLLERGTPGEVYNVASGQGSSIRELAERVLRRLNLAATIETDPALVRPSDIPVLVGDSTKLRRATGWQPTRTIDDIIDDLTHAAAR